MIDYDGLYAKERAQEITAKATLVEAQMKSAVALKPILSLDEDRYSQWVFRAVALLCATFLAAEFMALTL